MHSDQLDNIVEEEGHEMLEVHQLVSEAIDSRQQEHADLRTTLDSAGERLAFYRELDAKFQAALADATSRAADIHSKAEVQATALLKHVHDERAQLEATVESLQKYNNVLLSLGQVLQAAASALRQAEEQLEQRMQVFRQTATQMESPRPVVAERYPKLEEDAIEEPGVTGAHQSISSILEDLRETVIEEHPKLEEESIEEHVASEAQQSVSRTWVRIIGLRQIARLHHIEKTLKARSAIEDVRVVQYAKGVLVLHIGHRSALLPDVFKELPGVKVQEVLETEDGWIEVRLNGTNANSRVVA